MNRTFLVLCLLAVVAGCGPDSSSYESSSNPEGTVFFEPIISDSRWRDLSAHCGVRDDGALWCWAWQDNALVPYRVGEGTDWKAVSATGNDACAQKTGGSLWCWMPRSFTIADYPAADPVQLNAWNDWNSFDVGVVTHCGLRDLALFCWGRINPVERDYADDPQPVGSARWSAVSSAQGIAAMYHVCGIHTDASLWCWGDNTFAQSAAAATAVVAAPLQTPGKWLAVATSPGKTCGITSLGALRCWGQNTLGDDTGAVWTALATSGDTGCALQADQSLWCWGKLPGNGTLLSARDPAGRRADWASVAVGNDFICGRKASDAALCLHLPRKYRFLEPWFYASIPVRVD